LTQFSKLLLALDLSPESELLIHRVRDLCRDEMDNLHVVHVIKRGLHDSNLQNSDLRHSPHAQRMVDHTAMRIREMLRHQGLTIPSDRLYLVHGEPAFEIKRLASELDADLVIVGSHTKQDDWMQLPGATTNCVIQGISSDVMAVKV
jgi:universal stress protein A